MYIFRINKEKLGLFKHRGKTYLRLIENTSAVWIQTQVRFT